MLQKYVSSYFAGAPFLEENKTMTTVWNLDVIYNGLTDPAYEADVKAFEEAVASTAKVI